MKVSIIETQGNKFVEHVIDNIKSIDKYGNYISFIDSNGNIFEYYYPNIVSITISNT